MVGIAIHLVLVVMVDGMAIAEPIWITFMGIDVMETVVKVSVLFAHGFLGVQWGIRAFCCCAVLSHLVDKEYFGHVVYDEHFCPVGDWLGLSATEMNVHDEDGERGGGCDHSHGGYVVLP